MNVLNVLRTDQVSPDCAKQDRAKARNAREAKAVRQQNTGSLGYVLAGWRQWQNEGRGSEAVDTIKYNGEMERERMKRWKRRCREARGILGTGNNLLQLPNQLLPLTEVPSTKYQVPRHKHQCALALLFLFFHSPLLNTTTLRS